MTAPKNVTSRTPSSWEPQDDVLLRHLKEVKRLGWKDIAQYFNNRTPNACQFRWRRLKSGSLKSVKPQDEEEASASVNAGILGLKADGLQRVEAGLLADDVRGKKPVVSAPMPIPTSKVTNGSILSPSGGSNPNAMNISMSTNASVNANASVILGGTHIVSPGSLSKSPFSTVPQISVSGGQRKFVKPRSYSHSQDNLSAANAIPALNDQEENFGFIPKVFVRSRRGSAVVATPVQSNLTVSLSGSATSKSRKNSFSTRSRRSSFNVSTDRHFIPMSNTSSRRSSVVVAPTPLQTNPRRESFNNSQSMSRRNSVSQFRRGSMQTSYIDMPKQGANAAHPVASLNSVATRWSTDEDKLLLEKRQRHHLSIDEISILLPHRSEQEIQWRMDSLHISAQNTSGPTAPVQTMPYNSTPARAMVDDSESPSYSPDNAIDEHEDDDVDTEIVGRMEDSVAPTHLREHSPAFSQASSTGSSGRERSPVFSPEAHSLRDQSPSISDGNNSSIYGRLTSSLPKQIHQNHISHHPPSQITPKSSQSPQPTHLHSETRQPHGVQLVSAQPLPSLNTIFKHIS